MGFSFGQHITSNNKAYKSVTQKHPGCKRSTYTIALPEFDGIKEKAYQQPGLYKPWEDEVIKRFYKVKDTSSLCIILIRSHASILNRLAYLKIKNKIDPDYGIAIPAHIEKQVINVPDRKYNMFAPWEDEILKRFYLKKSRNHLAKALRKTASSLSSRYSRLACLKELEPTVTVKIPESIFNKIKNIPDRQNQHYTDVEHEIILRYFKMYGATQLMQILKRTRDSLRTHYREATCLGQRPNYDIIIPKNILDKLKHLRKI